MSFDIAFSMIWDLYMREYKSTGFNLSTHNSVLRGILRQLLESELFGHTKCIQIGINCVSYIPSCSQKE